MTATSRVEYGQGTANHRCNFCGKSFAQVRELLTASGHYICDQCRDLCDEVLREAKRAPDPSRGAPNCSFCGEPRSASRRIVAGPGVYICESCVDDAGLAIRA